MYPKSLPVFIGVLVLLLAGILLWFILSRKTPEVPVIPPEAPTESGVIREEGAYHEISADYPSSTSLRGEANVRAVSLMKTFVEEEIRFFKENSGLLTLSPEDIAMWGLGGERKFVLDTKYRVHTSTKTVSYVFTMYEDTLGAHPNAYYRTFTFDRATGTELPLYGLFTPGSDYLSLLSEKSRSSLGESLGESGNAEYLESGTTPVPDNFQHFYLEEDTLVIIFPPYQVGPWAIGTQEVRISKTELLTFLKSEYR